MKHRETLQRSIILTTINKMFHPTVNEIYEEIVKSYPSIGKATVYRHVALLCEEGLLRKITISDKEAYYDNNLYHHYHFLCKQCGHIDDLEMEYIPELDVKVKQLGYDVEFHQLLFEGICQTCHNNDKKD